MTMPNYIVNWKELYEKLKAELGDMGYNSIRDVQGVQKSKGFAVNAGVKMEEEIVKWVLDTSIVITAIAFSQENSFEEDSWEVWINGKHIFQTCYTHYLGDKKNWKTIQPLNKGDELKIIKRRNSASESRTRVWVDVEYIDVLDNIQDGRPNPPTPPTIPKQ